MNNNKFPGFPTVYFTGNNINVALIGPWTPAAECSLRSRDSASLRQQLSASEAGAPP